MQNKMSTQELRDRNGHLIARISKEGERLVIRDPNGHRKGEYDPRTNTTHDTNGHLVGTGNLLTTLL